MIYQPGIVNWLDNRQLAGLILSFMMHFGLEWIIEPSPEWYPAGWDWQIDRFEGQAMWLVAMGHGLCRIAFLRCGNLVFEPNWKFESLPPKSHDLVYDQKRINHFLSRWKDDFRGESEAVN